MFQIGGWQKSRQYYFQNPEKGEGELFNIEGYPADEGDWILKVGMYLYSFYCLCVLKDRKMDML